MDETNFHVKSWNDRAAALKDQCKWQEEIYPLPLRENTLSVSVRVLSDHKKAPADVESALHVISLVICHSSSISFLIFITAVKEQRRRWFAIITQLRGRVDVIAILKSHRTRRLPSLPPVLAPLGFSNADSREGRGEVDAVAPVIGSENGSHGREER